jgi:hypothetical protein
MGTPGAEGGFGETGQSQDLHRAPARPYRWSSILTFGMEATGLAAFVALLNSDPDAATRAVLGNALYLGATPGWLVGLLDTVGELPQIREA